MNIRQIIREELLKESSMGDSMYNLDSILNTTYDVPQTQDNNDNDWDKGIPTNYQPNIKKRNSDNE